MPGSTRACGRCQIRPAGMVMATIEPWGTMMEEKLNIPVFLCPDCRTTAAQENAAALSRRTGKDVR